MSSTSAQAMAWAKANPERHKANYKRWYESNKDKKLAENKARYDKLYAAYKAGSDSVSKLSYSKKRNMHYREIVVNLLRQRDGDNCGICSEKIEEVFHLDHITPRCQGGTDDASNLRLAHPVCNNKRPRSTYVG